MKRIIIVHQWMAGADGDWRPWLKSELEKKGYEVLAPEMPGIDTPVIEKWVSKLSEIVGEPNKDTYFIGHSIGCQTILRYLDAHVFKPLETVGGAIFVAGWFNLKNLEDEETEKIAEPWIAKPINAVKIKTILPKSALIISDNDPYDCYEENKERFEEFGSRIITISKAGHFTEEDGYAEFPEVLSELINITK